MHEIRFVALQMTDEIVRVIGLHLLVDRKRWRPFLHHVFEPEAQDEVPAQTRTHELGEGYDRREWEHALVLMRLGVDDGAHPTESRYLAVNALHFRLQKRAAERNDERAGIG